MQARFANGSHFNAENMGSLYFKIYAEMTGNVMTDARSTGKYYHWLIIHAFVRLMGRAASHVTLECALQTHPNITIIGEEVQQLIAELNEILAHDVDDEAGQWKKKLRHQSILLFEFLPVAIQEQLMLERDLDGNVQVAKIETEKMLISMLETELEKRKSDGKYGGQFKVTKDDVVCLQISIQPIAMHWVMLLEPPPFWKDWTHFLIEDWTVLGTALTSLMDVERRHGKFKPVIKKAMVELEGAPFRKFASMRDEWALKNRYISPGPIQCIGPGSNDINHTLLGLGTQAT